MTRLRSVRSGDVVVGITLIVALLIALDASEWLRGGFGWRWPYQLVPVIRLLPLALVAAVYLFGAWVLLRRTRRVAPLLLWTIAGSVALTLAGIYARSDDVGYELFARTASFLSSGQQWEAMRVDWAGGEWRTWTEVMTRMGGHLSNVPPGAPLLYALLSNLLDRVPAISIPVQSWLLGYQCDNYNLLSYTPGQWASSLLGMAMPLWAALTVVPLHHVAKRFVGRDAVYCALWWPLVPAVIAFAGSWSTLDPLFAVASFGLLVIGLERRRGQIALIASGMVFGVGVFVNFALIPLPILLGLYALGCVLWVQRRRVVDALTAGVWFGLGMILPWLIYGLLGGDSFFRLLSTSMQFHLSLDRPYLFWVGMHLWDWWLWTGAGFAALAILFLWRWCREHTPWRERAPSRLALLTAALALTMLILIVSGTARGETGRVWMFFSPFLLIVAAGALRLLPAPRFGALTVAQAIYLIALVASLNAMTTDFTPAPPAPQVSTATPTDATFSVGDQALFRLTGWGARVDGQTLDLRLNWQGENRARVPYYFGVVLVSPNGQTIGSNPWQPGGSSRYPTTCWAARAQVGDEVRFPLPPDAASGDWWVSLAAYSNDTQLTVTQPGQAPGQQVGLGPIHVGN